MSYLILVFTLILSVLLAMLFIPRILMLSYRKRLFDMPNTRKVHNTPVPRLGGVSFFPVIMITCCFLMVVRYIIAEPISPEWVHDFFLQYLLYIAGASILYFVGLFDDLIGVHYRYKFMAQILVACLLPLGNLWINNLGGLFGIYAIPAWIGMPLTVFMTVYIINAINLIDGIDGLASGLSCLALFVIIVISIYTAQITHAMLATSCLGVVAVFFYFNVFSKRRKIFMGDSGSLTLGFVISYLIIHYCVRYSFWDPFSNHLNIIALSTLCIPMFDVVRVFVRRLRDHRNPFLPDKNHIHHKLMRSGMRTRYVMLTILLMSASYIVLDYVLAFYVNATIILFIDLVLFVLMHVVINYFIALHSAKTGEIWKLDYNRMKSVP